MIRSLDAPLHGFPVMPNLSAAPDEASETTLVKRARKGDVSAFESLYRNNVSKVYALCLRLCGDASQAEELTQESFVRAWTKLASFRGESRFSTWLHRLTVNVVLGKWRRKSRLLEVAAPPGDAGGPAAASSDLAVDLERAIRSLPTRARQVFVLHDVYGYKHEEIANHTGIAPGTSKAQLHRARHILRKELCR